MLRAVQEDSSASGYAYKFIGHLFSGGAKCHLTGRARSAEVRFACGTSTRENVITSVKEFPTCNYVVTVSSPLLCKHHAFKPQPERVMPISCMPLEPEGGSDHSDAASDDDGTSDDDDSSSGDAVNGEASDDMESDEDVADADVHSEGSDDVQQEEEQVQQEEDEQQQQQQQEDEEEADWKDEL